MLMGIKWGGSFSTRDPVARVPVRGRVFGTADEVDETHGEMIGAMAVRAFGLAAARARRSLADPEAPAELAAATAAELAGQGVTCRITVQGLALDPDSAAAVQQAQPAAPAAAGFAVGAAVLVTWSDGNRYPGQILEAAGDRYRVGFPDGQAHWIEAGYLSPG